MSGPSLAPHDLGASAAVLLLDAGGVLICPSPASMAGALARYGSRPATDDDLSPHYLAVAAFDRMGSMDDYRKTYASWLGVPAVALEDAVADPAWLRPWTIPAPGAGEALELLTARFRSVAVVSDSDGTVEGQLAQASVCQVGDGPATPITAVFDSAIVGATKPDPELFLTALARLEERSEDAVFVGDSLRCDVVGAQGVGIRPVHIDPLTLCPHRADHDHEPSLLAFAHRVTRR